MTWVMSKKHECSEKCSSVEEDVVAVQRLLDAEIVHKQHVATIPQRRHERPDAVDLIRWKCVDARIHAREEELKVLAKLWSGNPFFYDQERFDSRYD